MKDELKQKTRTLMIQAFGEWGAFLFMTAGKNPHPDGSHLTLKYSKKIQKLITKSQEETKKEIIKAYINRESDIKEKRRKYRGSKTLGEFVLEKLTNN